MITVGVDLAAEPVRTGLAVVEWSRGGAAVREVLLDVDDDAIVGTAMTADKVGIDCPLGWPAPFVEFLAAHHSGLPVAASELTGRAWRRQLTMRTSDLAVHAQTGLRPLSVAADRIAHAALRCAGLLARLAERGALVDRTGTTGLVVEAYPAAALHGWGLAHRGYKRAANTEARKRLVDALVEAAPWLVWGRFDATCRDADDALDAVLSALVARAAARGLVSGPDATQRDLAGREGWIAVPTSPLDDLPV